MSTVWWAASTITHEDARELAGLLKGLNGHVNLIPVNPIKERDFVQPTSAVTQAFKNKLEKYGINVTIRREMGRDINGACGQLRRSYMEKNRRRGRNMKAFCITDVGQNRSMNQDFVFASETPVGNLPNLFVVADGMGGHRAGDTASRDTVGTLIESVRKSQRDQSHQDHPYCSGGSQPPGIREIPGG